MQSVDTKELAKQANRIRKETFELCHKMGHGHLGAAFSPIDILTVLYFSFLQIDPANPKNPQRDRCVLSKGHGCASLYIILAKRGFFPKEWLNTFLQDDSILAGHTHHHVPGVEVSTGSLGHGLSLSCGMAWALKSDNSNNKVVAILSDGECDEGSTWEAILSAGHHKLDNLLTIIDYNKIQSFGRVEDVLDLEPFADKFRACNWHVSEMNGHSMEDIVNTLNHIPFGGGKPCVIIAHTIKGKGVSFMENTIDWHYWSPNDEHLKQAQEELDEEYQKLCA